MRTGVRAFVVVVLPPALSLAAGCPESRAYSDRKRATACRTPAT